VAQAANTSAEVKEKAKVPTKLEGGELPLNTFNSKKPFTAKVKSVERIVGPKATGETCHIILETNGDIPFWEGQSYGVVPPVRFQTYGSKFWVRLRRTVVRCGVIAHSSSASLRTCQVRFLDRLDPRNADQGLWIR
jgi:hypothetical protein